MERKYILSVVVIFVSVIIGFAQENVIKTGLTNALFGDFNLSYERVINENNSLQVKAGYLNPMVSFTISEKLVTPGDYTFVEGKGGFHISAEYRFYLKKGMALKGLYLAPFIRHFNQRLLYTDIISSDLFDVDLKAINFGVGGQIGYQLIINDALTFDFCFIGLSLDHYNGNLKYTLHQPRTGFSYASITDDIDQSLNDYSFLINNRKHYVKADRDDVKIPFFFPGIRIGVSAGIAF